MRIAVVGSGAAAAGVLAGIERFAPPGADITVFDIDAPLIPTLSGSPDGVLTRNDIALVYRQLHANQGSSFPPPKSHFGQSLTKFTVEGEPLLWKSEHRGGLTNFWGGGMFPFTDREFNRWPITASDMDPFYRIVAEKVGVCGETDELTRYFHDDYINRPPLRTSPVIDALCATINRHGADSSSSHYQMLAGSSRLALETRSKHPHACVYSGECMLGCPRESVWSARQELDRYTARGFVSSYVPGRVRSFRDRHVYYAPPGRESTGDEVAGPFDRIYLAAGCIGSTEIVMRSLGVTRGPQMLDSTILSFPIIYLGGAGGLTGGDGRYFSLCNLSIMGVPRDPAESALQVSVYPAFDHLWRYYTPEPLWGLLRGAWRLGRWRLMLGRVYLNGAADRTYDFQLEGDRLVIRRGRPADLGTMYQSFMHSLRRATNHAGFYIPSMRPIGHGTSSHYAGTLPYGGSVVAVERHGRVAPGVHLADASTFADLPAISPTFTIMANACRTVCESLQD